MEAMLNNSMLAEGFLGTWQIVGIVALIALIVVYFKIRNKQQ